MRKVLTILLSVVILAIAVSCAGAEAKDLFDQINGQTFDFASGVGAWNTELTVGENGSFTGNFHDSEMGETGDDYPNGTVYRCSFHGQFTRFAAGDRKLEEQFFSGADLGAEANQSIRTRFVKEYVEANNLSITAYQDYGWDPVPLN